MSGGQINATMESSPTGLVGPVPFYSLDPDPGQLELLPLGGRRGPFTLCGAASLSDTFCHSMQGYLC